MASDPLWYPSSQSLNKWPLQKPFVTILINTHRRLLLNVYLKNLTAGGGKTDSTQEMIAVGFCSIFGSFFGCFPQTASFSRSSVLSTSGGQTQLANFFNGLIHSEGIILNQILIRLNLGGVILLALAFLMPTFYFIPKSVLGAVIITAVYPMIEFHEVLLMWRGRSSFPFPKCQARLHD